jgi:hypothetical protein
MEKGGILKSPENLRSHCYHLARVISISAAIARWCVCIDWQESSGDGSKGISGVTCSSRLASCRARKLTKFEPFQ